MSDTIVVDANNVLESGQAHHTIELTNEDQVDAVKRIGEMMSMSLRTGKPVCEVVKASHLTVIGAVVNIALLTTVADARAFVDRALLPTLDKLALDEADIQAEAEKLAAYADLDRMEPEGNA